MLTGKNYKFWFCTGSQDLYEKTEFKNDHKWPMRTHKMKTLPGVYRNNFSLFVR